MSHEISQYGRKLTETYIYIYIKQPFLRIRRSNNNFVDRLISIVICPSGIRIINKILKYNAKIQISSSDFINICGFSIFFSLFIFPFTWKKLCDVNILILKYNNFMLVIRNKIK